MEPSVEQPQPAKRTRNAKRSSLACTSCKRTKRRCDISQQLPDSQGCTNCKEKKQRCEVRYGEDRRRKRTSQNDTGVEARLALLENLLAQRVPEQRQEHYSPSIDSPVATRGSPNSQVELPTASSIATEAQPPSIARMSDQQSTISDGQDPPVERPLSHGQSITTANSLLQCPDGTNPDTSPGGDSTIPSLPTEMEDPNAIIGKVVSREGALEGQSPDSVRYFGPTSIYRLSNKLGARALHTGDSQATMTSSSSPWLDLPPDSDTSNEPEALVLYLVDLFCAWQASHLQIFDRELFLGGKKSYDNDSPRRRYEFFSPSLLYTIMALASMVSLDRGTRYHSTIPGRPVGSVYFDKAKCLFDREMGDPSITTVQTALLLGSYYGAVGYQSQGWTYSGIALRMAVELGLHISCDAAVVHGQLSPDIAQLRRVVFWGCYVQDKLWSAYCGRPSFIMDWDITVSRPQRPQGLAERPLSQEAIQAAVHWNIVLLTVQCSKILSELYSQKHSGNDCQLAAAAASIHEDLVKWHDELPDILSWPNESNSPVSPHVLLMHMQFYFTLLLLHRPFIDFSQGVPSTDMRLESVDGVAPSPAAICSLAATNITKLSRDYSLSYDLRQIPSPAVHFVFVAATIHLINHQVAGDQSHQLLFQGCLSSLVEIGRAYPTGQIAVSVLQDLLGRIQLAGPERAESRLRSWEYRASPAATRARSNHGQDESRDTLNRISRSVKEPTGTDHGGTQHNVDNFSTEHGDDLMNWTSGLNFDWSALNSPIAFPRELEDIDLNSCYKNIDPIQGDMGSISDNMQPMEFTPVLGNFNGIIPTCTDVSAAESEMNQSTLFLSRYYGTAFGLR